MPLICIVASHRQARERPLRLVAFRFVFGSMFHENNPQMHWQMLMQMMALQVGMSGQVESTGQPAACNPSRESSRRGLLPPLGAAYPAGLPSQASGLHAGGGHADPSQHPNAEANRGTKRRESPQNSPRHTRPKHRGASTQEVMQKIEAVVMPDNRPASPKTMAARILDWVSCQTHDRRTLPTEENQRTPSSPSAPSAPVVSPNPNRPLALEAREHFSKIYHYAKEQAAEASEAVQYFLHQMQQIKPAKRRARRRIWRSLSKSPW